jgi:hypothetical protein
MAAKTLKIHEVVKYPDPVLAKPGAPVTVFDEALKKLVALRHRRSRFRSGSPSSTSASKRIRKRSWC